MYPLAKRSLDYCIRTWDPDHQGALFEPHHNTYDIEFWGPDGMCTSIYLGALSAFVQMARAVGQPEDAKFYDDLAHRCAHFMDEQLFNGEYYQQKVQYQGLRNTSFATMVAQVDDHSSEMQKLLKREGPKYQYGNGCLSDGVIGAWMARIYGIETPLAREHVRSSLQSHLPAQFQNRPQPACQCATSRLCHGTRARACCCALGLGAENPRCLLFIPMKSGPESNTRWPRISSQKGFVKEGLTIVKALRSRYDGRVRNPWNEYECGNYYARAMASYALLGALSGFRYSAVAENTLVWLRS